MYVRELKKLISTIFQERRLKKERRRNRELRRAQRRQARIDAGLVPSKNESPRKTGTDAIKAGLKGIEDFRFIIKYQY